GSCRYVVEDYLPRFGVASTLVDGCNLDAWREAVRPTTKTFFLETPTNPALEIIHICAGAEIAHAAGGRARAGQSFVGPPVYKPTRAWCRLRRVLSDQTYRRPGPLPRRRHSGLAKIHYGKNPCADPPDRAVDVAV